MTEKKICNWQIERKNKIDSLDWKPMTRDFFMDSQLGKYFVRTKHEKLVKLVEYRFKYDTNLITGGYPWLYHGNNSVSLSSITEYVSVPDDWEYWEE